MNLSNLEAEISKSTEYKFFKFVCKGNVNNCSQCLSFAGKIFRDDDMTMPELPIHPNCQCEYEEIEVSKKILVDQKKIADNIITNHNISSETAEDLALQIIYSRLENKQIGNDKLFLLFNGENLISSDGKFIIPAVSGRPIEIKKSKKDVTFPVLYSTEKIYEFDYSYERQGIKGTGGIPQGLYHIDITEQRSAFTSPLSHIIKSRGWGSYSWRLHAAPNTDTRGRGGFFVHGGEEYGSAGCIDLHKKDFLFRKYFSSLNTKKLNVYVRYKKQKAFAVDESMVLHDF